MTAQIAPRNKLNVFWDGTAHLQAVREGRGHLDQLWENPVTRERAVILELPWANPDGRETAELTALVFSALAPIARLRGYRATYPQLSRTVLAPRT